MVSDDEVLHNAVSGGRWWRFDRYVVDQGVIRAAPGAAAFQYEPWSMYEQARRRRGGASRGQPAPYQELLQLGARLEEIEYERFEALPRRLEKLVLAWCRRNGLLGLLPHGLVMAASPEGETASNGNEVWSWAEWHAGGRLRGRSAVPRSTRQQAVADRTKSPPATVRRSLMEVLPQEGGVLIRPVQDHGHLVQPYTAEWARYFPAGSSLAAPRAADLDMEGEGFWRDYGEPVYDFMRCILLMYWSFLSITAPEEMAKREGGAYPTLAQSGYYELNELASVTSLSGYLSDSRARGVRWASPSLIGHYGVMMLTDLAGGNRVRVCDHCGAPFLSAAYRASYCSLQCRSAARKRRQREGHAGT